MYEICLHCNRTFYSREYVPGYCPVCEETLGHPCCTAALLLRKTRTERLVPRI